MLSTAFDSVAANRRRLYESESGRRYMMLYVIGVSDALQLSSQIECHYEKGTGPSADTMTARVADVLRGPDAPKAVAIAVIRVLRDEPAFNFQRQHKARKRYGFFVESFYCGRYL